MDISVIVPIYKGQKYVDPIIQMVGENISYAAEKGKHLNVELLYVNDYPSEPLEINSNDVDDFTVIHLENNKNSGIHQTRVNGLLRAKGEYILFLDQDDKIFPCCLYSQYSAIYNNDIVVGNGYRGKKGRYQKIYRSIRKQQLSCKEGIFLRAANQIVSPGHCLIRKNAIPTAWCENIMTDNGVDDFFLWLLMFAENKKFCINPECVYQHVETGINLSNDLDAMYKSSDNLISIAKRSRKIDKKKIELYQRRIELLRKLQTGSKPTKVMACLCNLDICLAKVYAYYK